MMNGKTYCTHCFKTLGVPSRMGIYKYLRDKGTCSVGEVVENTDLTQPTVSYHLSEMKKSGLLKSEKRGKEVFYTISAKCPHMNVECVMENVNFRQVFHV